MLVVNADGTVSSKEAVAEEILENRKNLFAEYPVGQQPHIAAEKKSCPYCNLKISIKKINKHIRRVHKITGDCI